MTYNFNTLRHKNLHDFIESACDSYCENLSDEEFNWLIEGLTERMREYLEYKIKVL